MVRDELYITVPSLFRCPISLDVMKSPVSLCTGVTYDRSSIQHWLESGHDTCPATMQILSTKDFVPNLTLHRLINLWAQSAAAAARRRQDSDESPVITEQEARVLMEESERICCTDSLSKIVQFLSCCEENRRFFVRCGFVEVVFGVLKRENCEIEVLEMVIRVLDLILNENGVKEELNRLIIKSNHCLLSSILLILQKGKLKAKIKTIRVLDSIAIDTESKRRIAETENLLSVLFQNLHSEDSINPSLIDAVLSCLISITVTRSVKIQLVQLGLVQMLSKTVMNSKTKNPIHEKSMKLLSIMSTCSEGRLAISEDPECAVGIVERLMKVSKTATENGVVVLWSMCCLFKDERVKDLVVKSNGVTKVLLVMQSEEGEGSVRRMCGDLVKALRVGCKAELLVGSYHTKTTHIMHC